ncbi:hypothetical protein [Wenxinia marina]|uniref:Uncharacterized protein n=1 Tax=Wenxinia marina DSM 24838 TaxID=1123501 RepID=A0A0D0NNC7_9RHOB|nr:hypothetical protein [Wenxinia marina]KIQ69735.1 hypothetical protein Wenmar_01305 [Wenxinia marina DSM 24838]GGL60795.1 hypothetical protein GCM10011392_14050 [Wenxinia marina]
MRLAALLALAAAPAHAALPCDVYDELVAEAVMVMQIADIAVVAPESGSACTVRGTVVRTFAGPHPPGTRIQTSIPCDGYPLPPGVVPDIEIGATLYWDFDALSSAAVIELHIAPEGGPAGYGAGVAVLAEPTEAPARAPTCG